MIIIRRGKYNEEFTRIEPIKLDYLKEINNHFLDTDIIDQLNSYIAKIDDLSSKSYFSQYVSVINKFNFYIEGVYSSTIENIISTEEQHREEDSNKILNYIKQVNEINANNKPMNNETISNFHDAIEPQRPKV